MTALPTVAEVVQAAEDYLRAPTKTQAQLYRQDLALKVARLRAAATGESFDAVLREALAAMREMPEREQALGNVARGGHRSIAEAVESLVPQLRLVRVEEDDAEQRAIAEESDRAAEYEAEWRLEQLSAGREMK